MRVEVERLSKHFGDFRAVDDISFSFSGGQVFGFVGPNGAGKTTTMRVLATIEEPTSGVARVDGLSVLEEPEKARRVIGYVPDSLPSHRDIDVHEYLDFFARAYGLRGAARDRVVESVEVFTNLVGLREKMIHALSKGMKQRVCLARALLHDPPVLILDEPAAGLDPRARIELRELLKVLASQGKAILISSHILTELAEICTGAVIIERGKILRAGTLDDIVQESRPHRVLSLRLSNGHSKEDLARELLQRPFVSSCRVVNGEVEVDFTGGDDDSCDLLAHLVSHGFRVAEFRQMKANLEDVFMSVTKGEVQ